MTRIFHWFFIWKMDPMSGCDIRLVFTLPPRDSTLQYKRCVHLWNNFPCIITLVWLKIRNYVDSMCILYILALDIIDTVYFDFVPGKFHYCPLKGTVNVIFTDSTLKDLSSPEMQYKRGLYHYKHFLVLLIIVFSIQIALYKIIFLKFMIISSALYKMYFTELNT